MSKFKVGDRFVVHGTFLENGNVIEITEVSKRGCEYKTIETKSGNHAPCAYFDTNSIYADFLKPYGERRFKILITTDGTTTLARLLDGKKVVKSAEAKCAPSDTFDFAVGANLAYDRLMGRAKVEPKPAEKPQDKTAEPVKLYCVKDCKICGCVKKGNVYEQDKHGFFDGKNGLQLAEPVIRNGYLIPLVKRPAKVGEWVYVTEKNSHRPRKDIYNVVGVGTDNCVWFECDGTGNVTESKYLVLDGYKG